MNRAAAKLALSLDRKHKMGGSVVWLQRNARRVGDASRQYDGTERSSLARLIIELFEKLRSGTVKDIPPVLRAAIEWWVEHYAECNCGALRNRHRPVCPKWVPKRKDLG